MASSYRTTLAGTAPRAPHHALAQKVADVADDEHIDLTVVLKPDAHRAALAHFCYTHNLTLGDAVGRHAIRVSGAAKHVQQAFGTTLAHFQHAERGRYRSHSSDLSIPANLADTVRAVLGLSTDRVARAHRRHHRAPRDDSSAAAPQSFTPAQVAALYGFPTSSTGSGQTIALIELGGGYSVSDVDSYFSGLGITPPTITSVSVDGARNRCTGPNGADGEVVLDIEVAGSVAPGAQIVVYFAPNTDSGFYDAVVKALHDTQYHPSVVSISWGGPEDSWPTATLDSFSSAFQAAPNVTVCVASGDNGSSDGESDGQAHVDFPASSPYVLACGGTRLVADASGTSIVAESVWNDGAQGGSGGGGVSAHFPVPPYQSGLAIQSANAGAAAGRGVPDVAGNADPQSGYQVRVDGQDMVIGGTSAVAPLWAGLVALLNALLGRSLGFVNPTLYAHPQWVRDITAGSNGAYTAGVGYDLCSGLGTPDGAKLQAGFVGGGAANDAA